MFAGTKHSSEKEIQIHLEIITCEPSIYTMDHPKSILYISMGNSISIQRDKSFECYETCHKNNPGLIQCKQ